MNGPNIDIFSNGSLIHASNDRNYKSHKQSLKENYLNY